MSGKCKFAKFVLVLKGYTSVPGKVIHPFHALTSCEKQNDRHFAFSIETDKMASEIVLGLQLSTERGNSRQDESSEGQLA